MASSIPPTGSSSAPPSGATGPRPPDAPSAPPTLSAGEVLDGVGNVLGRVFDSFHPKPPAPPAKAPAPATRASPPPPPAQPPAPTPKPTPPPAAAPVAGQTDPGHDAGATPLASERFAADPVLQKVAAGTATLPRNASGAQGKAAVKLVQQALADLGYALPNFGTDGDWGGETKLAMSRFQQSMGLPATGALDAATLATLDRAAPAPGTGVRTYPEYEKMFQDGVLYATLGVGYDETNWDNYEAYEIKRGLQEQGFQSLNVSSLGDVQLTALGLDPKKIDRTATYYLKAFDHDGKPARVLLKYMDRNDPEAKRHFAEGFASNELVLYAGHARYGSGPDFDAKDSTKGNFVLGVNAQGHKRHTLTPAYDDGMRAILRDAPNDLENTAMTPDYQLMLFSGCKTRDYRDELRAIPDNKNTSNLDLILSTNPLMWNHMGANVLGVLNGVIPGKSMEEMNEELYATNKVKFVWDGFADNPKR